jgi:hypothetical protein
MWAMILKEFRQLRRDRRTLAMMIALPLVLLVVFGYAASFDVTEIPTSVVGPRAEQVASELPAPFDVISVDPGGDRADAIDDLTYARAPVAIVTGGSEPEVLIDGSDLFTAQAAERALAQVAQQAPPGAVQPSAQTTVLFNPELDTSAVMIPGLAALILLFIGTVTGGWDDTWRRHGRLRLPKRARSSRRWATQAPKDQGKRDEDGRRRGVEQGRDDGLLHVAPSGPPAARGMIESPAPHAAARTYGKSVANVE